MDFIKFMLKLCLGAFVFLFLFISIVGSYSYLQTYGFHWSAPEKNELHQIKGKLDKRGKGEDAILSITGSNVSCEFLKCGWSSAEQEIGKEAIMYEYNDVVYGFEVEGVIKKAPLNGIADQKSARYVLIPGSIIVLLFFIIKMII